MSADSDEKSHFVEQLDNSLSYSINKMEGALAKQVVIAIILAVLMRSYVIAATNIYLAGSDLQI
jgi:hypothetical protein